MAKTVLDMHAFAEEHFTDISDAALCELIALALLEAHARGFVEARTVHDWAVRTEAKRRQEEGPAALLDTD